MPRLFKFGHISFCMGKNENYVFVGNYCSLKVGLKIHINRLMKLNEYQRSRSSFDLGQR